MSVTTTTPTTNSPFTAITNRLRANFQTYALIMATVLIWIGFSIWSGGLYLGAQNFSNIFRQMTITGLLSVGMVLVIVTGHIDLSVGKLAGFVSVVVAYMQATYWPKVLPDQELLTTVLSVLVGLAAGALYGVLQGYVIAYLRVPAFIVTLGSYWILNGAILLRTAGKTIPANQPHLSVIAQGYLSPTEGWVVAFLVVALLFYSMFSSRRRKAKFGFALPPLYSDLSRTSFLSIVILSYVYYVNQYNGIQIPVLILAVIAVGVSYISNNTRFGRFAYAIGGNREAARLSGVNIRNNIFLVFVLMGFLCGVSGVMLASYVGYGTIAAGTGYELDAIAACILGGTSTLGGIGTISGAMIGGLIMASLTTGLQIMNVAPAWQYVLKGLVLVLAVWMDVYFKRNR
jgi:D-xylose transport system permease protein